MLQYRKVGAENWETFGRGGSVLRVSMEEFMNYSREMRRSNHRYGRNGADFEHYRGAVVLIRIEVIAERLPTNQELK